MHTICFSLYKNQLHCGMQTKAAHLHILPCLEQNFRRKSIQERLLSQEQRDPEFFSISIGVCPTYLAEELPEIAVKVWKWRFLTICEQVNHCCCFSFCSCDHLTGSKGVFFSNDRAIYWTCAGKNVMFNLYGYLYIFIYYATDVCVYIKHTYAFNRQVSLLCSYFLLSTYWVIVLRGDGLEVKPEKVLTHL